jgi:hypothetical protein
MKQATAPPRTNGSGYCIDMAITKLRLDQALALALALPPSTNFLSLRWWKPLRGMLPPNGGYKGGGSTHVVEAYKHGWWKPFEGWWKVLGGWWKDGGSLLFGGKNEVRSPSRIRAGFLDVDRAGIEQSLHRKL